MFYLNTDASSRLFEEARSSKIYVDKSLLIALLSQRIRTADKYVCITRPRRFGKTVNANMLAAYYVKGHDSRKLFHGLKICDSPSYGTHLNQHNVIQIDFSRMPDPCHSYYDYIENIKLRLSEDLRQAYGVERGIGMAIDDLLTASGDSFIFVLDEWDAPFFEDFMGEAEKKQHLKFLKGLLKDRPYVELTYMTGILPITKYSSGSELNMFHEYGFMDDAVYEEFFGLTAEEVRALCQNDAHASVSYDELEQWYDGYRLSNGQSLFNPRSVNYALTDGVCRNYWTETGPMDEIADCIEYNVEAVREDVVKMVAGIPVEIDLDGYSVSKLDLRTRNEILSAMVVYGFLSYHEGKLQIPNHELMEKFQRVLSRDSMGEVKKIVDQSKKILEATLSQNEEKLAAMLEEVHHREIPFLKYGDENALSCVITLCYLYARKDYRVEREAKSGKGYCDYLFAPKQSGKPAIILELKVGSSCEEALKQIKEKRYVEKVKGCREILLVGINYDREKHHACKIERVMGDA